MSKIFNTIKPYLYAFVQSLVCAIIAVISEIIHPSQGGVMLSWVAIMSVCAIIHCWRISFKIEDEDNE